MNFKKINLFLAGAILFGTAAALSGTSYANSDVPFVNNKGHEKYKQYSWRKYNKAFAISVDGSWAYRHSGKSLQKTNR